MKEFNKIAIIGMSARFPSADSIEEVDEILTKKIDIIKPVSYKRLELQKLNKNIKYKKSAYLDNIEYFDYQFFNISKNEAMFMDPQHRIALELACEAFENSGYSLDSLNGTNTSVLIGAHDSHFIDMIEEPSGVALVGNFLDALPARISYFLNLQGEASIIQTSCSSGLTCVYDGCTKLNAGETDLVLAGAVTINFRINKEDEEDKIGIISSGEKCKTFDESADGTNFGEGAGFIVLKRYEDAKRDGDNILAIIKSIGVNQDGSRSNSLTAPSVLGQAELLEKTWKRGNINPLDIGYIEAHGTGTKIGDPIEISAITKAINKFTKEKQFCPIGSIKTNYTHLGAFSGIANIIKGILSFRYNKKYPLENFKESNKLIDFKNSPVYPITEVEKWDNNKKKLYATSAFGISGTNVHLVLEDEREIHTLDNDTPEIVTFSVKFKEVINEYKNNLLKDVIREENWKDVCYTLNIGRNLYDYRISEVVNSKEELIKFITNIETLNEVCSADLIFICSDDNICSEAQIKELLDDSICFRNKYEYYNEKAKKYGIDEKMKYLIQNISIFEYLKEIGITPKTIIGSGKGNIVVSYLTGERDLDETMNMMKRYSDSEFKSENFKKYINNLLKQGKYIFFELGNTGNMSSILKALNKTKVLSIFDKDKNNLKYFLKELILNNFNINWNKYYEGKDIKKVNLSNHPFRKIVAWPKVIKNNEYKEETIEKEKSSAVEEKNLYEFLHKLWCNELGEDTIDKDEDLFELGADSLMGMNIVSTIEKEIGIKIDFDVIYKYPTLVEQEKYLSSLCLNNSKNEDAKEDDKIIKYIERTEKMKASYNQKRILYLFEGAKDSSAYNMPCMFRCKGNINEEAFIKSVDIVVATNESFHTIYGKENGEYYQSILKDYKLINEIHDYTNKLEEVDTFIRQCCNMSFNLFKEIPIRSYFIKLGNSEYIWLINTHHIAADGWSVGVVCSQMTQIYKSLVNNESLNKLPSPKIQYVDYAYWENNFINSEDAINQLNFWKKYLKGIRGISSMPIDKIRPKNQTFSGSTCTFSLGKELTDLCKAFSKEYQVSLFILLETIYANTMSKISGEKDICIGAPVANRQDKNSKNVVGFYSNTIVIRNNFDEDKSFLDNLIFNKEQILKAYNNVEIPFEEVVRNIKFERDLAYAPVFQHIFIYQNYGVQRFEMENVSVNIELLDFNAAKFDMSMTIFEDGDEIRGLLEYNTDLYYEETIKEFIDTYKYYIKLCIEEKNSLLSNLKFNKISTVEFGENEEDYSW